MKFVNFFIALCFSTQVVQAQNYRVSKPPIDGIIAIAKKRPIQKCELGREYRGIAVQSASNTVYSIGDGEVTHCTKIAGSYLVMVRCDSLHYCYRYFKKVFVTEHQLIKTNTPLGALEFNDEREKYILEFSVWDNQIPHNLLPLASLLKLVKAQKIAD